MLNGSLVIEKSHFHFRSNSGAKIKKVNRENEAKIDKLVGKNIDISLKMTIWGII